MADKKEFSLDIVTPEGTKYSGMAEFVVLPGAEGQFGVLAGHAAILAALAIGELKMVHGGAPQFFAITDGFCEVRDNKVTVAVENAFGPTEIDVAKVEDEKQRCAGELEHAADKTAQHRLREQLRLAEVKLDVARKSHE
jgi:F-type H+-transporting ATPase subunit epsilon